MAIAVGLIGFALIIVLLVDIFKAVVLARRARGEFRLTRVFYQVTWPVFAAIARRTESGPRRENLLGVYGPLSLVLLFVFWAIGLILSFALVRWALNGADADLHRFLTDLYQSAASLFTIGAAETPEGPIRWVNVTEAGLGLSFLGLVVGYLPVFYQSFARRELHISLLDARAGSPPSAAEFIARQGKFAHHLERQLVAWEEWAADLLQDELSYPMLAYFRSQHLNQSWVSALVAMTDTSALISLAADSELKHQAEATFAMGRHALIDSARVLGIKPQQGREDRLGRNDMQKIRDIVQDTGSSLDAAKLRYENVSELMDLYEEYSNALSSHLMMALPSLIPVDESHDNWRNASAGPRQDVFAVSDPFQNEQRSDN